MTRARPLIATAVLVLAACGGSDDTSSGDDEADVTEANGAAPDDAAESAESATAAVPETTESPSETTPPTADEAEAEEEEEEEAEAEEEEADEETAVVFEPIGLGPYDVGVSTITVDDPAGERPLTVDVWFPLSAHTDIAELPAQQYTLLPGTFYESPDAVAADPAVLSSDGPFPLVVYSHGSGAVRYIHSAYTEALASHGYVVVAPDHPGNTAVERITGADVDIASIAIERPTDVSRVIDAFTDLDHPTAGPWVGGIDAEQIAVTGQSFGGFTAVAVATGVSTPAGDFAPDERVDAIIPIAPATGEILLPDDDANDIDLPMMIVAGTEDATTPIEPNVTRLWDLNDNAPAYRVELIDGEHQTFSDVCAYQEFLPTLGDAVPSVVIDVIDEFAEEGCGPDAIDAERAHDITNTYAVLFLDEVFRGGDPIDVAPPEDVIFFAR